MSRDLTHALRLIAITDHMRDGVEGLVGRAAAAVRGGATMVQIRLKDADARVLAEVTRRCVASLNVPVVVNDRADVALAMGAAGVHVGADDLPPEAIRRLAPAGFLIGTSVGSDDEAAAAAHADYAGIGPVYSTTSKADAGTAIGPAGFARFAAMVRIPCVGIGGISRDNARAVIDAGARGVAALSSVMSARDPEAAAREIRAAMDQ